MSCTRQNRRREPNQQFLIRAGGVWVWLALVTDIEGQAVTRNDVLSLTRVIRRNDTGQEYRTTLDVSEAVYDSPQTNPDVWDQAYNVRDVVEAEATPTVNVVYSLYYLFKMIDSTTVKTSEIDVTQFSNHNR